jgi:hypothetical protein
MKVYKVMPCPDCSPFYTDKNGDIGDWAFDSDIDSSFTVEVVDMSKEEFDNLPEYEGP